MTPIFDDEVRSFRTNNNQIKDLSAPRIEVKLEKLEQLIIDEGEKNEEVELRQFIKIR